MYTSPEEEKIRQHKTPVRTEVELLRENVRDLELQLQAARIRIKELNQQIPQTEEELRRKVMIARGFDPTSESDIKEFWRTYHDIEY